MSYATKIEAFNSEFMVLVYVAVIAIGFLWSLWAWIDDQEDPLTPLGISIGASLLLYILVYVVGLLALATVDLFNYIPKTYLIVTASTVLLIFGARYFRRLHKAFNLHIARGDAHKDTESVSDYDISKKHEY